MKALRVEGRRWTDAVASTGLVVVLGLGIRAVAVGRQPVIGWLIVGLALLLLTLLLRRLLAPKPRLVVDERGVYHRALGVRPVPWVEIEGAYLLTGPVEDRIGLKLRTGDCAVLDLAGTQIGAVEILERIVHRRSSPEPTPRRSSRRAAGPAPPGSRVLSNDEWYPPSAGRYPRDRRTSRRGWRWGDDPGDDGRLRGQPRHG